MAQNHTPLDTKKDSYAMPTMSDAAKAKLKDAMSAGSPMLQTDTVKALTAAGDHNHAAPVGAPNFQQTDNGKLTTIKGGKGSDRLIGGAGNDFLIANDKPIKGSAKGDGPGEFPFPNPSKGTTDLNFELKDGNLKVDGTYKNFDGKPLFSLGEKVIDPKAIILNGSDPQKLIDGFLKVPFDKEGNKLSATHLHFSPSQDSRGNFADATVVRFLKEEPTGPDSGKISGNFKLNPEEQAAFAAGNLYTNIHTNAPSGLSANAGFPTGENRVNFNQNVVKVA